MSLPEKIPSEWLNCDLDIAWGNNMVDPRNGKVTHPNIWKGQITKDVDQDHCVIKTSDAERLVPKAMVGFCVRSSPITLVGEKDVPASRLVTGR